MKYLLVVDGKGFEGESVEIRVALENKSNDEETLSTDTFETLTCALG